MYRTINNVVKLTLNSISNVIVKAKTFQTNFSTISVVTIFNALLVRTLIESEREEIHNWLLYAQVYVRADRRCPKWAVRYEWKGVSSMTYPKQLPANITGESTMMMWIRSVLFGRVCSCEVFPKILRNHAIYQCSSMTGTISHTHVLIKIWQGIVDYSVLLNTQASK